MKLHMMVEHLHSLLLAQIRFGWMFIKTYQISSIVIDVQVWLRCVDRRFQQEELG